MTWEYLAGFTDGDGCIGCELSKGRYLCVRLRWAQKDADAAVLDEIATFLRREGLKVSSRNMSVAWKGKKYPQRELAITNTEDTRKALHAMLPFLIVKRERAEKVLAVLDVVASLKQKYGNKYRVHMEEQWPISALTS